MTVDPSARRWGMQFYVDPSPAVAEPVPVGITIERFLHRVADAVAEQTADGALIDLETFKVRTDRAGPDPVLVLRAEWITRHRPEPTP